MDGLACTQECITQTTLLAGALLLFGLYFLRRAYVNLCRLNHHIRVLRHKHVRQTLVDERNHNEELSYSALSRLGWVTILVGMICLSAYSVTVFLVHVRYLLA